MQPLLTQLLSLDGITVENYCDLGSEIVLTVETKKDWAICPRCSQISKDTHQNHFHLARDLSFGQRKVLLKYNRRQFKCHECKKPFSEALDFLGERRRYRDRFAEMIVKQVCFVKAGKNLTQKQALKLNEIKKTLPSLAKMHAEKEAFRDIFEGKKLGNGVLKMSE